MRIFKTSKTMSVLLLCALILSSFTGNAQTIQPVAREYFACPGDSVYFELKTDLPEGYTFKVYTSATGSTESCPNKPTWFRKTNANNETAYLQLFNAGGTAVGSRVAVIVKPSIFCGATTDQNCSGVVLFYDDFGGNNTTDPAYCPDPLPNNDAIDLYFYKTTTPHGATQSPDPNLVQSGEYGLIKHISHDWSINNNSDHTHAGDPSRGYFMMIDPDEGMNNAVMYEETLTNLCSGADLAFSFWASDLQKHALAKPTFDIQLIDPSTGEVLAQSCMWTPTYTPNPDEQIWNQFGFNYNVPEGISSVKFRLKNRNDAYGGNDYCIDDIKVVFCGGKVNQGSLSNVACYGGSVTMTNTVTLNTETMFTRPAYKWQFTTTPNNESSWTNVPSSNTNSLTVNASNTGYYRMFFANDDVIDGVPGNNACMLKTERNYYVFVHPEFKAGSIKNGEIVCQGHTPSLIASLTDATGGNGAIEYKWQRNGVDISGATGATYQPTDLTTGIYTYTRYARNESCHSDWLKTGDYVLVISEPFQPTITASADAVCPNTVISLTTEPGFSYQWNVAGGVVTSGSVNANAVSVRWASAGNKHVTLRVTNADNCYVDKSKDITVWEKLTGVPDGCTFQCPDDMEIELVEGTCDTVLTEEVLGSATISCTPDMSDRISLSRVIPSGRVPVGEYHVIWSLHDDCYGGEVVATCDQKVIVKYAPCPSATDADGNTYQAERICCQCWFKENLKTEVGAHSTYGDEASNKESFGNLYTWYTAVGVPEGDNTTPPVSSEAADHTSYVQGVCPAGWGIPSQHDFDILNNCAGDVTYLKDTDTQYWLPGKGGTEPNLGFNSRGSGRYNSATDRYEDILSNAYYWVSDAIPGSTTVSSAEINYYCSQIMTHSANKKDRQSIRCIKKKQNVD